MRILVTGGSGFIGSAFIRHLLSSPSFEGSLYNLDALTYAALKDPLGPLQSDPRYHFIQGDIRNRLLVESILKQFQIEKIVHFAAETHVDRSIASAEPFIQTNVLGTLSLLEACRCFSHIHFHHVSTDEVFGSLGKEDPPFSESSPYRPNSPYSASKAAADHLVKAFAHTHGLFVTLSYCSNNYGIGQHREKFLPQMIACCLEKRPFPLYGDGTNIRDWLYVDDHVRAIHAIVQQGKRGETYAIGGGEEKSNLEMLHLLIDLFCEMTSQNPTPFRQKIQSVPDRPGHDFRYAIDPKKIQTSLGWEAQTPLLEGLRRVIEWHLHGWGRKAHRIDETIGCHSDFR